MILAAIVNIILFLLVVAFMVLTRRAQSRCKAIMDLNDRLFARNEALNDELDKAGKP